MSIVGHAGDPVESGLGMRSAFGKAESRKHSVLIEGKCLGGVFVAGCAGSKTSGPILRWQRSLGEPGC